MEEIANISDDFQNEIMPTRRLQIIAIDYGTNLVSSQRGNRSYLVAVDLFSKNPIVYPVREVNSQTIINFLEEIFTMFSVPEKILSDSGKYFQSVDFSNFLARWNVSPITIPFHHPQINKAEKLIGDIKRVIRSISNENQISWDENIQNSINRIFQN